MRALVADAPAVRRVRTARRARSVGVTWALVVVGFAVFCVAISVGDFPIPLRDVPPAIFGLGNPDSDFIIRTLRLPRALTAVLVGGAFGAAGAIFQAITNNPLASPDLIGISAGASTAAVFWIVFVGASTVVVSAVSLAGALIAAISIYVLAYRRGVSAYRLVLVGISVAAMLNALTAYMLTRARIYEAQRAMVWLTGSLNGRSWEHVRPVALAMAVLLPVTLALGRSLRALQLGDDAAAGLGVPVQWARACLWLTAVALTAVATAAAGPVSFVAFLAPPIARRLTSSPLALLPSALTGAVLLLLADIVARRLFAPTELPVGVVTGVLGAPYLLWLLARANRVGRGG